jgi:hypothetical protein
MATQRRDGGAFLLAIKKKKMALASKEPFSLETGYD